MTIFAPVNVEWIRRPRRYKREFFVERRQDLAAISRNAEQAEARQIVASPIVNFWGVRGSGKTWLLCHLQDRYTFRPGASIATRPTFTLFYSFPEEPVAASLDDIARVLAEQAQAQLDFALVREDRREDRERLDQARSTGNIGLLMSMLLALSRDYTPLLLLDNAENVLRDDWESVEIQIIEPLVSAGQALVVVAGRRQVLNWRRFEVRRRVMESDKSRVQAFDKQTVIEQIKRSAYDVPAELVYPYTAGNPLLVDALAQHIVDWKAGLAGAELDQTWLEQRRGGLLQFLRTSEAQLLENVPTALLTALYAVSPLRFYRLEALRYMLTQSEAIPDERPEGSYLNILRALDQKTEVVWWNRERRAYMTSQVVRQLVNRRQLLENRDEYIVRHRQAFEMYWDWVHEYPEASEDFIVEIWFHLASLYLAELKADELHAEAMRALEFAHQRLKPDRFMILPQQLRGDHELLDLLPDELRDELDHELGRLLSS